MKVFRGFESHTLCQFWDIAQLVEQRTVNPLVTGSSPVIPANFVDVVEFKSCRPLQERAMSEEHEIVLFMHFWARRGIRIPDPTHYPKSFAWYVKLWRYYNERKRQKVY